jgi:Family of unknown function (DUF6399)
VGCPSPGASLGRREDKGAPAVACLGGPGGCLVDGGGAGCGARRAGNELAGLWAKASLFPGVYWAHHVAHTRCARRKAKLRQALEASQTAGEHHGLTRQLPLQALEEWQAWARRRVRALQRASAAVEGRNGSLSPRHHNQRGLPRQRHKGWTVWHNFAGRALEGTTPAARFFGRKFPDLFAAVFPHMPTLPRPRQRQRDSGCRR